MRTRGANTSVIQSECRDYLAAVRPSIAGSLLVLCACFRAEAQVNVEPIRQQLAESGFGARLRLSLSAYQGNTQGLVTGASALLGGRSERHLGFLNASGDYAHLGGETNVHRSFVHLRHNYRLSPVLWWEEFVQSETDRFRRIRWRGLLGTGPRFEIVKTEAADLYYGAAYMLEYTAVGSDAEYSEPNGVHRMNNYAALAIRPDERISLSTVTYFQPRFDEPGDMHVLNVTGLEFKVTELLQSRIDTITRYETRTPEGVKSTDFEFKSSLELKF